MTIAPPPGHPKGPLLLFGLVTFTTYIAIEYSTFAQVQDKKEMMKGVERDKERLRMKRREGGGILPKGILPEGK